MWGLQVALRAHRVVRNQEGYTSDVFGTMETDEEMEAFGHAERIHMLHSYDCKIELVQDFVRALGHELGSLQDEIKQEMQRSLDAIASARHTKPRKERKDNSS